MSRAAAGLALLLLGTVPVAAGAAPRADEAAISSRLTAVAVEGQDGTLAVRLQTGQTPRYKVTSIGEPARIVIDLEGTRSAWRGLLRNNPEPIREVRGSQWRPGATRVVVELTRPVSYVVEERPDGLIVRMDSGAGRPEERVAQASAAQPSSVPESPGAAEHAATKDWTLKGQVEVGYRGFLLDRSQGLHDDNLDLEGELDFTYDFNPATRLRLHPRIAIDPLETARNRYDPLDAYLEYKGSWGAVLVGQLVESWAAMETFSPADLLNRRDMERDFYNPPKLGELMGRLRLFLPGASWIQEPTLSLYALPLFLTTPLPTNRDRFRFDLDQDNVGDLSNREVHPDFDAAFGARLAATVGDADVALFYYGGPGRFPAFSPSALVTLTPTGVVVTPTLTPVYYRTDTLGVSAQRALGPWVLKAEVVYTFAHASGLPERVRSAVPDDYLQYVVGVDRTFTDVLGKNEVTVTVEYSGEDDPTVTTLSGLRPFKSDLFVGARWQFHDQRRTEIRAFVAADVLENEQLWLVDFKTEIYKGLKLVLTGQFVNRGPSRPPDRLSVYGIFPNNSNVRVALRYEF